MSSHLSSPDYFVGVDLGQARDPTAIAVVHCVGRAFRVVHLERLPLHVPYPGVVEHVARLIGRPPLANNSELIIDFTGVGRPVFDMFDLAGIEAVGVQIVAGDGAARAPDACGVWNVGKVRLISRLQSLLHQRRLLIQRELPDAPALIEEMQDFRATVTEAGRWTFGARAGRHDDLVLALAIACWRAYGDVPGRGWLDYYRELSEGRTDPVEQMQLGSEVDARVRVRLPSANERRREFINGRVFEVAAGGTLDVTEADAALLARHGWVRCGPGDGRARVRWRDPAVRYATFADGHLFEVAAGGELAVEEDEARLLAARGWVRVG